ncbi:MAG: DUF3618 domain-containing protein [Actinomycetes bacterium]
MSQDLPRRMQMVSVGDGQADMTPEEIERHIERTREQLAGTIDALAVRVSPREVTRRSAERAREALSRPDGRLDLVRVGGLAAGLAFVALLVWRRLR